MLAMVELKSRGSGAPQASWSERRVSGRLAAEVKANLRRRGSGVRIKAEVVDISTTGCRLLTCQYAAGDEILLAIGPLAPIAGQVCWSRNGSAGVRFGAALHPSIVEHLARG